MILHRAPWRVVALLLAGLLLAGCTSDAESPPQATTTPSEAASTSTEAAKSPKPKTSSTPRLRPVAGKRDIHVHALGSRPVLGLGDDPARQKKKVSRAVRQVATWLDGHLDRLQRTGSGNLGDIAPRALVRRKADRRLVTTHLASPDAPVRRATYRFDVYHDGSPRYLTARVTVRHVDDSITRAELVFLLEGGKPRLTLYGPVAKKARG